MPRKKSEPTLDDAIKEVKRELKLREKVYPDFIARGKLTQQKAQQQIARLEKALELLEALQPQQMSLLEE